MDRMKWLEKLVDEYLDPNDCHDFGWFAGAKDVQSKITRSGMSRNSNGKRHWHQRRIGETTLRRFVNSLLAAQARIEGATNFDSLHAILTERRVKGIGALALYDVALRIGAHRKYWPNSVYLHAGTASGAKRLAILLKDAVLLEACKRRTIAPRMLPRPLRRLKPWQIEDFLCRML